MTLAEVLTGLRELPELDVEVKVVIFQQIALGLQPTYPMLASRGDYSWMHKYVFPGGLIPSVQAIEQHLAQHTGLRVAEQHSLGEHYARTLARWRENFLSRWETVAALGFDSTFRRMWEFYLAYCEAGFRVGYLDVFQFSLARERSAHA